MKKVIIFFIIVYLSGFIVFAQEKPSYVKVFPKEIFDVLNNPGIGFTTFQRFNGDTLNPVRWTEGFPIEYQSFNGDLTNTNYPQTSIAFFRVAWAFLEPEQGKYNWPMIDKALRTAAERGQTLMLMIAPYETTAKRAPEWLKKEMPFHANYNGDVPTWYRNIVGQAKKELSTNWLVDPEDPRYVQYFGGCIAALGQRYDGHPDLESVNISFVGPWGEGEGTGLLSEKTRVALINSYLDNFKKTPLQLMAIVDHPEKVVRGTSSDASWPNGTNNGTGRQMRHVGYMLACWGDIIPEGQEFNNWGGVSKWSHMQDIYPDAIIKSGMSNVWKKAPVTFEICWTFSKWLDEFKWNEGIVSSIFDEALNLHVSSFNAKSSPVPDAWRPLVDKWLNKMGYRFVLRHITYPLTVYRQGQFSFTSIWKNSGVAPIYKDYKLAIRLRHAQKTILLPVDVDIREWLPGDIICEDKLYIPFDAPLGKYQLEIAIVDPVSYEPRVQLAIEGKMADGWYPIGEIEIKETNMIFKSINK